MKPVLFIVVFLAGALLSTCASPPSRSGFWGTPSRQEFRRLFREGMQAGKDSEPTWKSIVACIHILEPATVKDLMTHDEPALSVLFLARPDADLHRIISRQLDTASRSFHAVNAAADRLALSGNSFGACLHYAAAACISQQKREQELCLTLAGHYAARLPGPELSGTATAILRSINLRQHHQ
ncbi:MAG TPA: hypothetical protein PLD82_03725 [Spirochaetota bacterium]|nr:hypothetical protein [Spirochaetota bacterium]HPH03443.1 hypothetical protein [Spirochaetota bacterium]